MASVLSAQALAAFHAEAEGRVRSIVTSQLYDRAAPQAACGADGFAFALQSLAAVVVHEPGRIISALISWHRENVAVAAASEASESDRAIRDSALNATLSEALVAVISALGESRSPGTQQEPELLDALQCRALEFFLMASAERAKAASRRLVALAGQSEEELLVRLVRRAPPPPDCLPREPWPAPARRRVQVSLRLLELVVRAPRQQTARPARGGGWRRRRLARAPVVHQPDQAVARLEARRRAGAHRPRALPRAARASLPVQRGGRGALGRGPRTARAAAHAQGVPALTARERVRLARRRAARAVPRGRAPRRGRRRAVAARVGRR